MFAHVFERMCLSLFTGFEKKSGGILGFSISTSGMASHLSSWERVQACTCADVLPRFELGGAPHVQACEYICRRYLPCGCVFKLKFRLRTRSEVMHAFARLARYHNQSSVLEVGVFR